MEKLALWVTLQAKPGKQKEIEEVLRNGLQAVEKEKRTHSWFAIRLGPETYGIFDTFSDESARQAHLAGKVAEDLKTKAGHLLQRPPQIERVDVVAAKLPH